MPRFSINPQKELKDDSTARVIAETDSPRTRESLRNDLRSIGVETADRVIVHTSMQTLGWVNGGPVAYIQAL